MKFFSDSGYYVLASILPMILSFIFLPIYLSSLSIEQYAIYCLLSVAVLFLSTLAGLQLHSSVARYYFDYEQGSQKFNYISTLLNCGLALSVLVSLVLFLFLILFRDFIILFLEIENVKALSVCIMLTASNILLAILTAFVRVLQKSRQYFYIMTVSSASSTVVTLVLLKIYNLNELSLLLGHFSANVISIILFSVLFQKSYRLVLKLQIVKQSLKLSIPVIPHAFGGMIFLYSDIWILNAYASLVAVALYSLSDKLAKVLKIFINAAAKSYSPIFMRSFLEKEETTSQKFIHFVKFWFTILPLAFALILLGSWIFVEYFLSTEYLEVIYIVPLLLISYSFRGVYMLFINFFYLEKKVHFLSRVTVLAAILNIVLNYIFVSQFSHYAAAFSTLASFILMFLCFLFYVSKLESYVNINNLILRLFSSLLFLLASFFVCLLYGSLALFLIIIVFFILYFISNLKKTIDGIRL